MDNEFFLVWADDGCPLYDLAVMSDKGTRVWRNPECNYSNNSHSVTKLFIACAAGMLHDSGALDENAPVLSFFTKSELPQNVGEGWENVTVAHALMHKTGLDDIPYGVDNPPDRKYIGNDYLRYVLSLPIQQAPGEYYRYSDAAYYLLSRIISKAAGVNALDFLRERIFNPLEFAEYSVLTCPFGYPVGGGGLFAASEDTVKLGMLYASGGIYNGRRLLSDEWIELSKQNDYALTRFRDTEVFLKTGAHAQIVAFSSKRKTAVSWHGFSLDSAERNDRLLEAFVRYLDNNA